MSLFLTLPAWSLLARSVIYGSQKNKKKLFWDNTISWIDIWQQFRRVDFKESYKQRCIISSGWVYILRRPSWNCWHKHQCQLYLIIVLLLFTTSRLWANAMKFNHDRLKEWNTTSRKERGRKWNIRWIYIALAAINWISCSKDKICSDSVGYKVKIWHGTMPRTKAD